MPAVAEAAFGLHDLQASARNEDGSIDLQAGSHPYQYTLSFQMHQDAEENPEGVLDRVVVDLPPGLLGDPESLPRCTGAEFESFPSACPGNTQIGVLHANVIGVGPDVTSPIYNLTPSPGVAASFGFGLAGFNILQEASIRGGGDYGATVSVATPTTLKIASVSATIWGVPADSGHDPERQCIGSGEVILIFGCSSDVQKRPFLSLPTACGVPLRTSVTVHSVEGATVSETVQSLGEGGTPEGMHGCERPGFDPTIVSAPETSVADSPTGLHFSMHLPQNLSPEGTATAHLKNAVVTLPKGLSVNPSAAYGLGACLPGQIGLKTPLGSPGPFQFTPGPAECPASSEVGTVQVLTPLVDHPLPGVVYLAEQGENPFGSLIALYITVFDPVTGVVAKIPAKVQPDPVTGQLVTTVSESPQVPFEDFVFDFFGGPRAPLTTPAVCGTYTTTTDLTPWTTPAGFDVFPSYAFPVSIAPGGGACAGTESQLPNSQSFQAGTTSPLAGSYSSFAMKLIREDGSQRLGEINVTLPPGMTGKLAGVARCSEAQLAAAAARSNLGQGALEQAGSSCPAGSEVGTVTVGAGSGTPFYATGHAYLAGPYEGAPFSLAILTPAVAGPFDLGVVVVRSGLYINPDTAQVTVKSDPLPTILHGIPLDVRTVQVNVNRPEFTLNPTSCEPMSLTGEAISTVGQAAQLSSRFQAAGCQGLPFKPSFTASTQGKTSKLDGASLTVKVAQRSGEANIHRVALTLPLVLPARLTTLQKACTEGQFAVNPADCPEGSFIGTATAHTPLLNAPLAGPAILVSHGGAAFPDVEFLLQGEGVQITLDGKTDIKKGITHSRFETVPDAPISSFETVLPRGPHSALAANANLCTSKLSMPTQLVGQNGARLNQSTRIAVTGCPKTKALTRAKKLAIALKACHKKPKGAKRASCERQAHRKYGPIVRKARKRFFLSLSLSLSLSSL